MRGLFIALALLGAAPAFAQVNSRPTDPPIVTAENESWYRLAEPLQFAGDVYYPAGATVFFNGNTMVRTGHYNGIPLYADTTIEPYSIVLVPVARGIMQPYEKPRHGDLAGTTGTSILTLYRKGQREMYGVTLPDGLRDNARLPEPIITPTSKAFDGGHARHRGRLAANQSPDRLELRADRFDHAPRDECAVPADDGR